MPRPTFPVLVLLALWLLPACRTVPNPDFEPNCERDEDCADQGEGWTCNEQNICEPPSGADCSTTMMCPLENEPICDTTLDPPTCRACASDEECRAKDDLAPYCSPDGTCTADLPPECFDSGDCTADATKPICNTSTGDCRGCDEVTNGNACSLRDESTPYCVTDGDGAGSCAGCLDGSHCTADAPLCDPDVRTCGACKEHVDCDAFSGVCGESGACVPSTEIIHVHQANGDDSPTCGALDATCASIRHALTRVDASHRYILVLDGQGYAGALDMNAGIAVTIIGEDATISGASNGEPVVDVSAGADVTLEGMTVISTGTGANGISCNGSTLRLKRVTIRNNNNRGVASSNCDLIIERSKISANAGGGVQVTNSSFRIVNNFILDNGSGTSAFGGIQIANVEMQDPQVLAFNTILNNNAAGSADTRGVDCDLPGVSPLRASSNILRGGTGGLALLKRDNCDWVHSNIEGIPADLMVTDKNNIDDPCDIAPGTDNLPRIDAASMCKERGEPNTGVDVDYDGDTRPDGSGPDKPDMGADELVQAPAP